MSDRYFVDTNILMYAHDSAAGDKHARAKALVEELWQNRSGVVSTQVLQELAVNLRRKAKKPLDAKATREVVSDYLAWQVVVNAGDSILEALELEARYQISFWDALVIQAAQAAGTDVLYSEDLSDGQRYGSVKVKNPFKF
jgi:predicted nucleic acid-binding protein